MLKRERHMLAVQKKDNKVWIDLDSVYPPKHQQPNTVFKSTAIVLKTMGSDVTYQQLMGISGAAFRIQLHQEWCPSSPHPDCGFNCTDIMRKALKLDTLSHTYTYKKNKSDTILKQIIASIEKGMPVIASSYETGLVVGYTKKNKEIKLLYREPYSNIGDKAVESKIVPASYTIFKANPPKPAIQFYIESLKRTEQLSDHPIIGKYYLGFTAYEKWISDLLDESKIKKLSKNGQPELSNQNAHIYYSLLDARQCAAEYLRYIEEIFGVEFQAPFKKAAEYYEQIAEILQKGMKTIVWGWKFAKGAKWTEVMRKDQAHILQEALTIERKGIHEIKKIVNSL
jgi:hypothetical protein